MRVPPAPGPSFTALSSRRSRRLEDSNPSQSCFYQETVDDLLRPRSGFDLCLGYLALTHTREHFPACTQIQSKSACCTYTRNTRRSRVRLALSGGSLGLGLSRSILLWSPPPWRCLLWPPQTQFQSQVPARSLAYVKRRLKHTDRKSVV